MTSTDHDELEKLRHFHKIFSNYFRYWYCEKCQVQFEHEIGLGVPACSLCDGTPQPWIVAAAKEAKREAKLFEDKYNTIVLDSGKIFAQFGGIRKICEKHGYVEADGSILKFLKETLNEYETLLNALPQELRTKIGKAKDEEIMSSNSSPHTNSGSPDAQT